MDYEWPIVSARSSRTRKPADAHAGGYIKKAVFFRVVTVGCECHHLFALMYQRVSDVDSSIQTASSNIKQPLLDGTITEDMFVFGIWRVIKLHAYPYGVVVCQPKAWAACRPKSQRWCWHILVKSMMDYEHENVNIISFQSWTSRCVHG
jgi:hypothetical protein